MRLYPDATNRFLNDPTSGLNTEASRETYKKTLRALAQTHPDKQLDEFVEDDLVDYCSRDNLSPASKAGYRARLEAFFSWAKWKGLIKEDPSANLKRLVKGSFSKPVREHHWLNVEDVSKVLGSVDTSDLMGLRTMVVARLGFTIGLRRQEIVSLRWKHVDLERQQITLTGKGGKLASTYITDTTLPWLEKWYSMAVEQLGRKPHDEPVVPKVNFRTDFRTGFYTEIEWTPVGKDVVTNTVKKMVEATGIRFAPHDMRRSFANMLEEKGASIEEISAALRHSNLGTTQRYLERRQDAAFKAVRGRGLDV